MSLELELALGRQRIVAGEDLAFRLTVKNRGANDQTVRDPAMDDEWPKLEVLDSSGYRAAYAGRTDRERSSSHEFLPPPAPERVTLAPGTEASTGERMLRWIGPLAPGSYTARARLEADGIALLAPPSPLEVEPLRATRVQLVGTHAGPSDLAYALVTHRERDGTHSLIAWLHSLDFEGHLHVAAVQRLGSVGPDAIGSVSRAGLPYPGQWIVESSGDRLRGFFSMQGSVMQRLDAPLSTPAVAIAPALVELEGCDGSAPPRAEVLLHAPGRVFVACIAPDGSVTEGASWALEGELEWGAATLPESNVREAFLALRREDALFVVQLRWSAHQAPETPSTISKLPASRVLGGASSLGAGGAVYGAIVTRRELDEPPARYELVRFGVDASGRPAVTTSAIATDPPRDFVQAFVAVRPDGASHVLLQGIGGAWWSTPAGLARQVSFAGEPLALRFFRAEPSALIAVDRGVEYHGLAP